MSNVKDQSASLAENGDYGTHAEEVAAHNASSPTHGEGASSLRIRFTYGLFLIFGFVLGMLVKNNIIQFIMKWEIEHAGSCSNDTCIGNQGAYRVSFALFLFFMFHYVMSHKWNLCLDPSQRIAFNNSRMLWKLIAFVPTLFIAFVIPNNFFVVYAWFCVVVSVLYLIGQLIILLEFSYAWSDAWAKREEQRFAIGLAICTLVMFVASIVVVAYLYVWFGNSSACQYGQAFITITLLAGVVYTALSIYVEHGSILPSAVVLVYTVFNCYSALSSGIPAGECNTIGGNSTSQLVVGAAFACLSLVCAATGAGASKDAFELEATEETSPEEAEAGSYQFFHLMMMMGSCYLAMLLTSWSVTGSSTSTLANVDSGMAPMWAKFSSELVCIVLYLWTLAAPYIFKDRAFG